MTLFISAFVLFPLFRVFWPMLVVMAVFGYFNAIVNVLIMSVLQLGVPGDKRGKVFGLLETLTQGLTPLGFAVGGVLGEVLPLPWVMSGSFIAVALFFFPQLGSRPIREFFAIPDTEPAESTDTEQPSIPDEAREPTDPRS
jgi:DHA3 family macrolide efflux protein-like MFS transporter